MPPSAVATSSLWWHGPDWLRLSSDQWPNDKGLAPSNDLLEAKSHNSHHIIVAPDWDLSHRYSSWPKLLRVTAYIFRFINRCRPFIRVAGVDPVLSSLALIPAEYTESRNHWLNQIQTQLFPDDQCQLKNQGPLSSKSLLRSLHPFLDENGLIRVGGRLRHSDLAEKSKHPIIIASHPLVKMLIRHVHLRALHAGPKLTVHLLREDYWLLRARQVVRAVIHDCVECTRQKGETAFELMGDLPQFRVRPTLRAFIHCGVDYAGPFQIRYAPGRGHKSYKAYVVLFICMVTRALHLDLVSDYTTAAFLAVYKRFCSHRGIPSCMYSDNATNFRGAQRELALAWRDVIRNADLLTALAEDEVNWRFIPPSTPHFGGLWEAGVKSVKHHLRRVVGLHTLTFEEMTTLLCQIEACLNSRPLAPISDAIDDYSTLTPGHFLIGSALAAIPEPTLLDVRENRLTRWQLITQLRNRFWQSWLKDYLHTLQQRPKWRIIKHLAKIGRIVLLKNSLVPPSQWELGRIIDCHPGDDGVTRVVTVKTANSSYKRPLTKVCFLPVEIDEHVQDTSNDLTKQ